MTGRAWLAGADGVDHFIELGKFIVAQFFERVHPLKLLFRQQAGHDPEVDFRPLSPAALDGLSPAGLEVGAQVSKEGAA